MPSQTTQYKPQEILNRGFDDDIDAIKTTRNSALRIEYSGDNPVYIGQALPGSLTSASLWQIRKLTFDGNGNVTVIQYANGSPNFNQAWDDRVSLNYS